MKSPATLVRRSCISFLIGIGVGTYVLENAHLRQDVVVLLVGICGVASVALSMYRFTWSWYLISVLIGSVYVAGAIRETVSVTTLHGSWSGVVRFVEPQSMRQRLIVRRSADHKRESRDVFVYIDRYPEYRVGDVVIIDGECRIPERFEGFAFDRYAARRGIAYVCHRPRVRAVGHRLSLGSILDAVRGRYMGVYNQALPNPEASLVKAMVLNVTGAFPESLRVAYARSGLSHAISVSGLHMTLLIVIAEAFLRGSGIRRSWEAGVLSCGLFLYLLLLGFPAPAVRSSIMGVAAVVGRHLGRRMHGAHVLVCTAAVMALQNPLIVGFDIGFQLSFLALLGLSLTRDTWDTIFHFVTERYGMREMLVTTTAAQVFTWPLTLLYFGSFSSIAPLANALALPALPLLLSSAFIAPLVYGIPYVGSVAMVILFGAARYVNSIAEITASLPYAAVTDMYISITMAILFYGLLGIGVYYVKKAW